MEKELIRIKKFYDRNFKLLVKSVGTEKHKKYIEIENRLNTKEISLMKKLGILAHDPCPVKSANFRFCDNCHIKNCPLRIASSYQTR